MAAITTIPPINDPVSNLRPLEFSGCGFAGDFVVVVVFVCVGVLETVDEFEGAWEELVAAVFVTGMVDEFVVLVVTDAWEVVLRRGLVVVFVSGVVLEVDAEADPFLGVAKVSINKLKNLV